MILDVCSMDGLWIVLAMGYGWLVIDTPVWTDMNIDYGARDLDHGLTSVFKLPFKS